MHQKQINPLVTKAIVEALIHMFVNPCVTHYKATEKLLSGGAEAPNVEHSASQRNQNTTKIKPGK